MRTVVAATIFAATISAASAQTVMDGSESSIPTDQRAAVIEAITGGFADPYAVRLRKIQPGLREGSYCGELNAKNSRGAYTGFIPFALDRGGRIVVIPPDPSADWGLERRMERINEQITTFKIYQSVCHT